MQIHFEPQMILQYVALLLGLSFHEMSHAWAASRLGDRTAEQMGRLSMNPLVHMDPFGTVLFPVLMALSGTGFLFAWAKPTPVRPQNFRNPRRDDALVAAAGPISNLVLALAAAAIYWLIGAHSAEPGTLLDSASVLLKTLVLMNLVLLVFNLLPIPPLDGGSLLVNSLPRSMYAFGEAARTYGIFVLFALLITGVVGMILGPILQVLLGLLGFSV